MPKQSYDIFISYRRSSYDTANLIATRLKAAGYSVFFDMETLRSGKFNEQLFEFIDNCKDFILILPPNALDRCVNEDDWVRLETLRAMSAKKNIIPVMLNGFAWPTPMPAGMEELSFYQALTASSVEYFDLSMERLQKKYLLSKPHVATKLLAKKTGILAVAMAVIFAILYGIFMILSKDVCRYYAVKLVNNANAIHILADENISLKEDWNAFVIDMKYEKKDYKKQGIQQDMLARIDLAEKNAKATCKIDSSEMNISNYHSFLLSLNGISSQDISISPAYSALIYNDFLGQLEMLRNAVNDPNAFNLRYGTVLQDVFVHTTNTYYVGVLAELSDFPKSSLETYNQMSPYWYYYPKEYKLGESANYYEEIINRETAFAEDKLSHYESVLEKEEAQLEDLERKLDNMENQMDEDFAKMEADIYKEFKNKNTIVESDGQWIQWGKIVHWGAYLSFKIENMRENIKEGIDYNSSVTPDMICNDIISQLSQYEIYHPEGKDYVAATKAFYKEIAKDNLNYAGVIIYAFLDNVRHSIFEIGDIIVEYDGKKIKNLEDLKIAYKLNEKGAVKILRHDNGVLKEVSISQIQDVDMVGFVDLTE
ncbi:MAG: TIR domain-containing protein [Bacteroidales bacterium]|nr:TIR domain-containing protein [Bacteroidales bacterium]